MSWSPVFSALNLVAMIAWAALILLPRGKFVASAILYLGVGLLCFAYALGLALILGGVVDTVQAPGAGEVSFTTIEGVRAFFLSDGGVTIGWAHYLAFDLFVGLWIAKDADAKHFSRLLQAPVLLLTLVAGPAGLLLWLVIRERRARALNPR